MTPRHPGIVSNLESVRFQGIDQRTRMLLQRTPVPNNASAQPYSNNQMLQQRMPVQRAQLPITEHYDVLQQRFPGNSLFKSNFMNLRSYFSIKLLYFIDFYSDANHGQVNLGQRIIRPSQNPMNQGIRMINPTGMARPPILPTVSEANVTMSETSEIPDNVTAELEKLEQEGGAPMVEVENVSAILEDLGDDDDELLGKNLSLIKLIIFNNKVSFIFPRLLQLKWGQTLIFWNTLTLN